VSGNEWPPPYHILYITAFSCVLNDAIGSRLCRVISNNIDFRRPENPRRAAAVCLYVMCNGKEL